MSNSPTRSMAPVHKYPDLQTARHSGDKETEMASNLSSDTGAGWPYSDSDTREG